MAKSEPVYVNGRWYSGVRDAGLAYHLPSTVVDRRCKSNDPQWSQWYFEYPKITLPAPARKEVDPPSFLVIIKHTSGLVHYSVSQDPEKVLWNMFNRNGIADTSIKLRNAFNRFRNKREWIYEAKECIDRPTAFRAKRELIEQTPEKLRLNGTIDRNDRSDIFVMDGI